MGISELPLNREAIIKYLEDHYHGKYIMFNNPTGPITWYSGMVNRINVEVDADTVEDCTVTLMISGFRVETSVLTFIHNTVRHGYPQRGATDNG